VPISLHILYYPCEIPPNPAQLSPFLAQVAAGAASAVLLEAGGDARLMSMEAGRATTVRLRTTDAHGNALTVGGSELSAVLEMKGAPAASNGKENLAQVCPSPSPSPSPWEAVSSPPCWR
jgi:hypothetical protein